MTATKGFVGAAVALLVVACSRPPEAASREAVAEGDELMRSMSETLAQTHSFAFDTHEKLETVKPDGSTTTLRFTRRVTVRRPDRLAFEIRQEGGNALELSAIYDGQKLAVSEHTSHTWAEADVPGSLDEMLDDVGQRFGLPIPVGDVIYSSPYDAFLAASTRGGVVGHESIDRVRCTKLEYVDDYVEVTLWIPMSGQPLPRRLEIVYLTDPSHPKAQIDFTRWNLNVGASDAGFNFQPPEGYTQMEMAPLVSAVTSGKAPPVAAAPAPGQ